MLIKIVWDVSPFIFQIGDFGIRWYSLLFGLSFVFGYLILQKIFQREGIEIEVLDKLSMYMLAGTVIGARLGHCLFYEPDYYLSHPLEMILPVSFQGGFHFTGFQGLASHGAAIGNSIAIYLFSRKYNRKFLWTMDRVVIVVALAAFLIRTGNLMNSEIYGHATTLPWGFVFARNNEHIAKHPTQLYEGLSYLIIFFILLFMYKKYEGKPPLGLLLGTFLTGIFGLRFLVEFIKETQVAFEENMRLNMGQLLSIPIVISGIALIFYSIRKTKI
jgi:prolipoprotein diacylglyceryl transferase